MMKWSTATSISTFNICSLLHVAALYGNTEVVKVLMDEGVSAASKNDVFKTPMHLAAANGHAR